MATKEVKAVERAEGRGGMLEQEHPKKQANWWKRGVLIVAGGFVLTIGGCAALVGVVAVGASGGDSEEASQPTKTYQVGEKAQTVDMTWLVTDAYQTQELKDVFGLGDPKHGNFVVVNFKFTNGKDEEVTLDPESHMKLEDSRGRTFSPDDETFSYIPDRKDIFLEQVNPGVTQSGMVIFTVPPGAKDFTFVADDVDFMEDSPANIDLGF
jgi:Domain of unknown function (DUF4352)